MKVYHFRRMTTEFFTVSANNVEEARTVVKEDPARYRDDYRAERWYLVPGRTIDRSEPT